MFSAGDDVAARLEDDNSIIDPVGDDAPTDADEELDIEALVQIPENDTDDDEDEEDLAAAAVAGDILAPSGLLLKLQRPQMRPSGRMAAHNVFRASHVGLAIGFHPETSGESFKAYFGNCIDLP